MQCRLISDNIDTQVGMRLAGVAGTVLHTRAEVLTELKTLLHTPDVAIIFLTEKIAETVDAELRTIKQTVSKPLLVVIPDRHGSADLTAAISRYLQETVGIHI